MGKRKKMEVDNSTNMEWIATYSDTVTLLLTFFILLYSFSSVDAQKFQAISKAFQNIMVGQSGDTIFDKNMSGGNAPLVDDNSGGSDIIAKMQEEEEEAKKEEAQNQELFSIVKAELKEAGLEANVTVIKETKGVVMEFSDNILFDPGKAEVRGESISILVKVSSILKKLNNSIVVEGHTDNIPISTSEIKSNWELSCFRAVNVLKYFIEVQGINPGRLSAVGYGEYKNIVPNDSSINRAKNRRVNIMILFKEGEYKANE